MNKTYGVQLLKLVFSLIFLLALTFLNHPDAFAQDCPFGIENCRGGCGRWIDNDGDGICDKSLKSFILPDTIKNIDTSQSGNINTKVKDTFKLPDNHENQTNKRKKNFTGKITIISSDNFDRRGLTAISHKAPHRYNLILYSGLTIGFYLLSLLLLYLKVFTKKIHRRIWNVLLLMTFLISGLLGLLLVVQINYKILSSWFIRFLHWHVDFGIAMALISVFHIIWHFTYFRNFFRKASHMEQP